MGRHDGWNRQWVWPLEKGRGRPGFFGHLHDILTNSGPDIFIQRKGSRKPIKTDRWANWDSYHFEDAADREWNYDNKFLGFSRGTKRYDPYTRKYKEWTPINNWAGNVGWYPALTVAESHKFGPHVKMENWDLAGPKRFRPEYNGYWRAAHRAGENMRIGRHPTSRHTNPEFSMANDWRDKLQAMNLTRYQRDLAPYGGW